MSDNPFEGPYNGTFHILQETGIGPGYTIGGMKELKRAGESGRLRAVMITKAHPEVTWLPSNREIVTLQEILDALPTNMLFGSISWMVLDGETEPTTAVIHSGVDTRGLRTLTYARLFTSLASREEAQNFLKKSNAQTNADREILKDTTPVTSLLKNSKENGGDEPKGEEGTR
jgi:transcriptional regulator of aromatic amino acid metabolism